MGSKHSLSFFFGKGFEISALWHEFCVKFIEMNGWTRQKICNFITIAENLRDLRRLFQCKSCNFCCINKPLLKIALDNVVPDEMHLLLRVTVIKVIQKVSEKNAVENFNEVERGR